MSTKNPAAVALGSIRSERKATSSRENGRKGGRPRVKRSTVWEVARIEPDGDETILATFHTEAEADRFMSEHASERLHVWSYRWERDK